MANANAIIEAARLQLATEMWAASKALRSIPGIGSGPMGLTPDHIKFGPEYRAAKAKFDAAKKAVEVFDRKMRAADRYARGIGRAMRSQREI